MRSKGRRTGEEEKAASPVVIGVRQSQSSPGRENSVVRLVLSQSRTGADREETERRRALCGELRREEGGERGRNERHEEKAAGTRPSAWHGSTFTTRLRFSRQLRLVRPLER